MSKDALDSFRLWLKRNIPHGAVYPEVVVKDGVAVRVDIKWGENVVIKLGMPDNNINTIGVDNK